MEVLLQQNCLAKTQPSFQLPDARNLTVFHVYGRGTVPSMQPSQEHAHPRRRLCTHACKLAFFRIVYTSTEHDTHVHNRGASSEPAPSLEGRKSQTLTRRNGLKAFTAAAVIGACTQVCRHVAFISYVKARHAHTVDKQEKIRMLAHTHAHVHAHARHNSCGEKYIYSHVHTAGISHPEEMGGVKNLYCNGRG